MSHVARIQALTTLHSTCTEIQVIRFIRHKGSCLIFGEIKLKLLLYFHLYKRSKSGFKIGESNGGRKTSKITQTSLLVRFPPWRMKPAIRLQAPRLGMMEITWVLAVQYRTEDACRGCVFAVFPEVNSLFLPEDLEAKEMPFDASEQ